MYAQYNTQLNVMQYAKSTIDYLGRLNLTPKLTKGRMLAIIDGMGNIRQEAYIYGLRNAIREGIQYLKRSGDLIEAYFNGE